MGPSLARVRRFVDSVPNREIGTVQALAAGDVHDVWIRRSHGDGADRLCRFPIKDGVPGAAVVVGLPYSAVNLADVKHIGLARNSRRGARPASAEWSNHPPV